jgi:hypothetical protein
MPEVHVYVSARDKALIAALPPDVTVAEILRQALNTRRNCDHALTARHCRCCGAVVPAPNRDATPTTRSPSDGDPTGTQREPGNPQVTHMATTTPPDAKTMTV